MAMGIVLVEICFYWLKKQISHARLISPLLYSLKHMACLAKLNMRNLKIKIALTKTFASVSNER